MSIFRTKVTQKFIDSGVTGEIQAHNLVDNERAISRTLKNDRYFTFGIRKVEAEIESGRVTRELIVEVMAKSLGISSSRFLKTGPSFIEPDRTFAKMDGLLSAIDDAIDARHTVMLGTGHPGSLLKFYLQLEQYVEKKGGKLFSLAEPVKLAARYAWVDSVKAVIVQSDLGSLQHTHDSLVMEEALDRAQDAGHKVGLVVADHGLAGAAINAGIKTVGLHDVDDPGIPLAAHLGLDVLAVPMNDNQLNVRTASGLIAMIDQRP